MITSTILGLLIPFIGTSLGAVARDHGLNEEAAVEPAEQ